MDQLGDGTILESGKENMAASLSLINSDSYGSQVASSSPNYLGMSTYTS